MSKGLDPGQDGRFSRLFAKVISRQQKSLLPRQELNIRTGVVLIKQLVHVIMAQIGTANFIF